VKRKPAYNSGEVSTVAFARKTGMSDDKQKAPSENQTGPLYIKRAKIT